MALAAHEVTVAADEDHVVGVESRVIVDAERGIGGRVQKAMVVDKERGIAANVEKTTVAVDLGDGNVGVIRQQKVVGVNVLPAVSGCVFMYPRTIIYWYSDHADMRCC